MGTCSSSSKIQEQVNTVEPKKTEMSGPQHRPLKRTSSNLPRLDDIIQIDESDPVMRKTFAGIKIFNENLKTYISSKKEPDASTYKDLDGLITKKLLEKFEEHSSPEHRQMMGDLMTQINLVENLVDYYKFVAEKENIPAFSMEIMEEDDAEVTLIEHIRTVLWNFSDNSLHMAMAIAVKTDMLSILAVDLKQLSEKEFDNVDSQCFPFLSAVAILHNIARTNTTKDHYRVEITEKGKDGKTGVMLIDCLTPFLRSNHTHVKMVTLLALAHMVTEEQSKSMLKADNNIFDFILDKIEKAKKDKESRHMGFSLKELLDGLAHLAKNDENKKTIMGKKSTFPLLKDIVMKGTKADQTEAAKVFWELAFKDENKIKIVNDKQLMKQLHLLKNDEDSELAASANGVCFLLRKLDKTAEKTVAKLEVEDDTKTHIMISYNWNDQKVLLKVKDRLQKKGYDVWMDVDKMEGDILQAMAKAVESAELILMCYSEKYKESKNCRTEAEYAYQKSKTIIPLLMQKDYAPDGWLGALVGSKLYFEFNENFPFEKKMGHLLKEISSKGIKALPAPPRRASEPAAAIKEEVVEWKQEDLQKWLKDNHLAELPGLKSLTVELLTYLNKMYHKAPEYYFRCLDEKLKLGNLEDQMRFQNALDMLRKEHPDLNVVKDRFYED